VATLKGSGRLAGRVVIVGAHYDHLGRLPGQPEAGPARPGAYYPGANDNASGVSVLIELACQAARAQAPAAAGRSEQAGRRRCLFVAFAGEEVGLQGSSYLVKHLPVPRDSVDVMINFDTVGQMLQNELYVGGIGTAAPLGSLVEKANPEAFPLQMSRGGWSASDHVSFSSNGVPVLFVFTGAYPQYNRPEDSWSTIDAGCLGRVAAFGGRLLGLLRTTQEPLTYIQVNEAPLLPEAGGEPPRRAWLGTIPDFTEEVTGVKLAGVIDGSPAAQAGLAAGDVLVMLAGEPVADLAGFTRILREHQPGQEVDLEVLRNGQRLRYSVVLADRADRKP
jgi:hypothetical protein